MILDLYLHTYFESLLILQIIKYALKLEILEQKLKKATCHCLVFCVCCCTSMHHR